MVRSSFSQQQDNNFQLKLLMCINAIQLLLLLLVLSSGIQINGTWLEELLKCDKNKILNNLKQLFLQLHLQAGTLSLQREEGASETSSISSDISHVHSNSALVCTQDY